MLPSALSSSAKFGAKTDGTVTVAIDSGTMYDYSYVDKKDKAIDLEKPIAYNHREGISGKLANATAHIAKASGNLERQTEGMNISWATSTDTHTGDKNGR